MYSLSHPQYLFFSHFAGYFYCFKNWTGSIRHKWMEINSSPWATFVLSLSPLRCFFFTTQWKIIWRNNMPGIGCHLSLHSELVEAAITSWSNGIVLLLLVVVVLVGWSNMSSQLGQSVLYSLILSLCCPNWSHFPSVSCCYFLSETFLCFSEMLLFVRDKGRFLPWGFPCLPACLLAVDSPLWRAETEDIPKLLRPPCSTSTARRALGNKTWATRLWSRLWGPIGCRGVLLPEQYFPSFPDSG